MSTTAKEEVSPPDVARKLLSIIRTNGLAEGDRLPSIRQLAARFAVRPHVVRDALMQLQSMGHVLVRPRSRAIVRTTTPAFGATDLHGLADGTWDVSGTHLFHLLDARQTLEMELVSRAATRRRLEDLLPCRNALDAMQTIHQPDRPDEHLVIDMQYHLAIAQLADNPVLTSLLKSLLTALRPFLLSRAVDEYHAERTKTSHMEIYRALVAGDPELARRHLKDHLQLAYDRLLLVVQSTPAAADA